VSDVERLFDTSPKLRKRLTGPSKGGDRINRNTLTHRLFRGGDLKVVAGKAPRNLRRHTARILLVDEADAIEASAEGDPPEGTYGRLAAQPSSGDVCYYCRQRFSADQMRYRIMHAVPSGWGAALLCMECFKLETDVSCLGAGRGGKPAPRHTIQCAGCGEYINTILNPRYQQWLYCSNRCYQRCYRKRRRGRDSVIDWKVGRTNQCEVCKKQLDAFGEQHRRRDALYCSGKCRQWAYRRRRSRP
jgi:hypothetical protein